MTNPEPYKPKNQIRIITATSLFDGHDATINIIRRMIQSTGGEVIHLGHNRSVDEIVNCAIQEDAQSIAITSYQGGHIEFFKYMFDLLHQKGSGHIKVFGGGGGVILPDEKDELISYGIAGLYTPDDGRRMGLQGMINDLMEKSDYPLGDRKIDLKKVLGKDPSEIASLISKVENFPKQAKEYQSVIEEKVKDSKTPVVGVTGTGGAGKSSMVDEVVRRFRDQYPSLSIGIVSVDPSKRKSGGALLGDRIRMNAINHSNIYMRSLATRQANLALSAHVQEAINILKYAGYELIILESSGIGQSDTEIIDHSNVYCYVMTPEFGAASQLEKIAMLDYADIVAINKFDKQGALDALRDVKKQYQRNHKLFDKSVDVMPVFGTIASQYNNEGLNIFFESLKEITSTKTGFKFPESTLTLKINNHTQQIIPSSKVRYLAEIAETARKYDRMVEEQAGYANKLQALTVTLKELNIYADDKNVSEKISEKIKLLKARISHENLAIIENWESKKKRYSDDFYEYEVRGKKIKVETHIETLSHSTIPKIAMPTFTAWGDILKWNLKENVPGEFPYAAETIPLPIRWTESKATLHRLRFGHPLRCRSRYSSRYLWKGW